MRFIKFLLFAILLLFALIFAATFIFEQQIKDFFIKQVNGYLKTELTVDGDISFSVIRNFPYASLILYDVKVQESLPKSKANLLEANQLAFLLSWNDVFAGRYTLKKLVVNGGLLNVRILKNGQVNYDILVENPPEKEPSADTDFTFSLEEMILKSVLVQYLDESLVQKATFIIKNNRFSGNFGNKQYVLTTRGDLLVNELLVGETDYLSQKNIQLDVGLQIDVPKNKYTFTNSNIFVEQNRFNLNGMIRSQETATDFDMVVNGVDLNLAELLQLLPPDYTTSLKEVSSRGELAFQATVKGKYTERTQPAINVNFNLENGRIDYDLMDYPLKKVNIKGFFTNGTQKNLATSELDISQFNFRLAGSDMESYLRIRNLDDPYISAQLSGLVELKAFQPLAEQSRVNRLSGAVILNNLLIEGKQNALTNTNASFYPTLTGVVAAKDIAFKYNDNWVENMTGDLQFNGKNIGLNNFLVQLAKSNLQVTGDLNNLSPLLAQSFLQDSLHIQQPVDLNLQISSNFLDFEEITAFAPQEDGTTDTTTTATSFEIGAQNYVNGLLGINLKKVKHQRLEMKNVISRLAFTNRNFKINQLIMDALGGSLDVKGNFSIDKKRQLIVKTAIDAQNLDMQQLLYDFEDFGQETLTHDNINGRLNAKVYLKTYFNRYLQLDAPKTRMVANIVLEDGELINFEPMLALSKFAKLSELKRVRFARIENQLEIAYQKLRIPTMYINSNVLRMTFSGMHTFENRILYHVRLNLLKLLAGKFRKKNKSVQTTKAKKGGINLNVTMKGDAYNPDIKYMQKKEVKRWFEQDQNRQKTDLDKLLAKEFGPNTFVPTTFLDTLSVEGIQWSDSTDLNF